MGRGEVEAVSPLSLCLSSLLLSNVSPDGDFFISLSTATSPPIGGSLVSLSLGGSRFLSLSMALIGYLSFGVSLDSFSGFSLSLGGSSLDDDRTPSWCLSSKVKRVLCCLIMHVFRLGMFLF